MEGSRAAVLEVGGRVSADIHSRCWLDSAEPGPWYQVLVSIPKTSLSCLLPFLAVELSVGVKVTQNSPGLRGCPFRWCDANTDQSVQLPNAPSLRAPSHLSRCRDRRPYPHTQMKVTHSPETLEAGATESSLSFITL
ncbi:hypothetical protein MHYP_G00137930 [Metynnis hypsauchen]